MKIFFFPYFPSLNISSVKKRHLDTECKRFFSFPQVLNLIKLISDRPTIRMKVKSRIFLEENLGIIMGHSSVITEWQAFSYLQSWESFSSLVCDFSHSPFLCDSAGFDHNLTV